MVEADEFVGSLRAIPGVTAPVIHEGLVLMSPKHHLAISTSGLAWRITVPEQCCPITAWYEVESATVVRSVKSTSAHVVMAKLVPEKPVLCEDSKWALLSPTDGHS